MVITVRLEAVAAPFLLSEGPAMFPIRNSCHAEYIPLVTIGILPNPALSGRRWVPLLIMIIFLGGQVVIMCVPTLANDYVTSTSGMKVGEKKQPQLSLRLRVCQIRGHHYSHLL